MDCYWRYGGNIMFPGRFAVGGGSIPPPAPTISYGSLFNNGTQINATINNYSTEYNYIVTVSPGTFSRTGSSISISNLVSGQSFNLLVIATSAKGLSTPSSAVTDRQPYTYRTETRTGTRFVDTTSCYTPSPGPTCPFGGNLNQAGTQCCIPSGYTETYTYTVSIKNDTPAGYLDSGYDWYKVGNVTIERTPYTYYTENYTYQYGCTNSYPCQQPYSCEQTCTRQITCYGITTCTGSATYYSWGCGGTGCCVCPNGMGQVGCTCYYQCQVASPCTEYYSCPGTCYGPSTCYSPGTCTGYGSRQVRNATPAGYIDSGVDWYKYL